LDLGGASTQIAFQVPQQEINSTKVHSRKKKYEGVPETHKEKDVVSIDANDFRSDDIVPDPTIINVQLFGRNYSVKAQSNLCFGMDQARLRHQFILLQRRALSYSSRFTDPAVDIIDPCMPSNSKYVVSGDKFMNPCLDPVDGKTWKSIIADKLYNFIGSSGDQECQKSISEMLDWTECSSNFQRCFQFDTEKSRVTDSKKIIAISGFYYASMILPVNEDSSITQEVFEQETSRLCKNDLNDLIHTDNVEKDFVDMYCFQLKYVDRLLTAMYQIHGQKFSDIIFTKKINQQSFGWTLGLMINATNILPAATVDNSLISELTFICICITASSVILVAIVIGYQSLQLTKPIQQHFQYSDHHRVSPIVLSQSNSGSSMKQYKQTSKQVYQESPSSSSKSSSSPLEQQASKSLRPEDV
jgi:hypothetical protein